ncbi:hypothetical protein D3C76_1079830 [compost metagenome]
MVGEYEFDLLLLAQLRGVACQVHLDEPDLVLVVFFRLCGHVAAVDRALQQHLRHGVDLPVLGNPGPHVAVFAVTQAGIEATQFHDHVALDQRGGDAIEDVGADEIVEMHAVLEQVVQLPPAVAVVDLRVAVDQPDLASLMGEFVIQGQLQFQLLWTPLVIGIEHRHKSLLRVPHPVVAGAGLAFVGLLQQRQAKRRREVLDPLWSVIGGTIVNDDDVIGQAGLLGQGRQRLLNAGGAVVHWDHDAH